MKQHFTKKTLSLFLVFTLIVSVFTPLGDTQTVQAGGSYYIRVNRTTNVVTVYKTKKIVNGRAQYSNPVKAFVCSTGYATPVGTFYTPAKYRWWTLDGPSYGQYCTRIHGGILFHSVWSYAAQPNTVSVVQYNKLGTTASHGCVRLTVADAKWIYDNCSLRTEVNIFNGSSKNDPLGKPESIKLNTSKKMDWCPTDPDSRNPYKNKKPSITGAKNLKFQVGTKMDLKKNIRAKDSCGNDITSKLTYTSNIKKSKTGTYKLTYQVTDALKRTIKKTVKVTIYDNSIPIISGAKNRTIKIGDKLDLLSGVTAKTKSGKDVTSTLKTSGKVNLKKAGSYKVTYIATANGRTTKKTVTIKVVDKRPPVITGAKNLTLEVGSDKALLRKGIKAKAADGTDLTSKITISGKYDLTKPGTYSITYTVKSANGMKVSKKVTLKVTDNLPPVLEGTKDLVIVKGSDPVDLLSGVTAKETSGKDITDLIQIEGSINYDVVGSNTITYSVTGSNGLTTKETIQVDVIAGSGLEIIGAKDMVSDQALTGLSDEEKMTLITKKVKAIAASQIKGYSDGKKLDDSALTVAVEMQPDGRYLVTFTLTDESGKSIMEQVYYTVEEAKA